MLLLFTVVGLMPRGDEVCASADLYYSNYMFFVDQISLFIWGHKNFFSVSSATSFHMYQFQHVKVIVRFCFGGMPDSKPMGMSNLG